MQYVDADLFGVRGIRRMARDEDVPRNENVRSTRERRALGSMTKIKCLGAMCDLKIALHDNVRPTQKE